MRSSHLSESTNSKGKTKREDFSVRKKSLYLDVKHETNPSKSKSHLNGEKNNTARKGSSLNQSSHTHGHKKDKSISTVKHEGKKTDKISRKSHKQQNTTLAKVTAVKSALIQSEKSEDACKKDKRNKTKENSEWSDKEDCSEMASMSFEAYLSYDLEPSKRKKRRIAVKNPKRLKTAHKVHESWTKTSEALTEDPLTTVLIKTHQ